MNNLQQYKNKETTPREISLCFVIIAIAFAVAMLILPTTFVAWDVTYLWS
jgi:hypothetical protein